MSGFGERVGTDHGTRIRQRPLGRTSEAVKERRQRGHAEPAEPLALRQAPLMEAVAVGEVEPIEELAGKQPGNDFERLDIGAGDLRRGQNLDAVEVDHCIAGGEADTLAVGRKTLRRAVIDQRPELGETPAQRRPRIVWPIPEEVA